MNAERNKRRTRATTPSNKQASFTYEALGRCSQEISAQIALLFEIGTNGYDMPLAVAASAEMIEKIDQLSDCVHVAQQMALERFEQNAD